MNHRSSPWLTDSPSVPPPGYRGAHGGAPEQPTLRPDRAADDPLESMAVQLDGAFVPARATYDIGPQSTRMRRSTLPPSDPRSRTVRTYAGS
ncbi:MAG: hypothetical protein PGN13_10420 [Patulibacter minatonensis]